MKKSNIDILISSKEKNAKIIIIKIIMRKTILLNIKNNSKFKYEVKSYKK